MTAGTKSVIYEKLAKALAEMPSQLPQVEGYGYRYTPLPNIINAIRPILAKHGLGLYQEVETNEDGEVVVRTIIFSSDGEVLKSPDLVMPVIEMAKCNKAQSIGATITYARRYSLSAFLGIATEEDTDAHSNGTPRRPVGQKPKRVVQTPMPEPETIPEDVLQAFQDIGESATKAWEYWEKAYASADGNEEKAKKLIQTYIAKRKGGKK